MANITTGNAANATAAATAPGTGDGRPDGAAGAVWDALRAAPDGATTAELALAAGVSRASVSKALNALATDGRAIRTPGTGTGPNRTPDTWTAAPATNPATTDPDTATDTATDADAATDTGRPSADAAGDGDATDPADATASTGDAGTGGTSTGGAGGAMSPEALAEAVRLLSQEDERRAAAAEALARAEAEEAERRARADAELIAARRREDARVMLTDLLGTVMGTLAAVAADDEAGIAEGLAKIADHAGTVRRATRTTTRTANGSGGSRPAGAGDRTAPTPLRPLVEAHLTAHPDAEFTPGEIARVLDRSSGAVANALDTLTGHGLAVLTCDKPRRYRAANPTGTGTDTVTDTAAATDGADGTAPAPGAVA